MLHNTTAFQEKGIARVDMGSGTSVCSLIHVVRHKHLCFISPQLIWIFAVKLKITNIVLLGKFSRKHMLSPDSPMP